jgi:lambda family phage minor tail protein L
MLLDVNKQRVDSDLVELFEVEVSTGSFAYFTTYTSTVKFYDAESPYTIREYIPLPMIFSGFEHRSEGAYARPTIVLANVLTTFKDTIGIAPDDLIGRRVIRRKTLAKHLATGDEGTSGSIPVEQPRQIFYMDRLQSYDAASISFELTTAFDLQGVTVPNRYILANTCSWLYQGAAHEVTNKLGGCTWKTTNNNSGFEVRYDNNDRPIIAGTIPNMPTAGTSVVANYVYRVAENVTRVSDNTTATGYKYYQALLTFTKTATFETANFRRCRHIFGTWSDAVAYETYKEGKLFNPIVEYNSKCWLAVVTSTDVTPGTNEFFWERVDICGKKLSSCAKRFKARPITSQGFTAPYYTEEQTDGVLPYGGFPGAKRFNR